MLEIEMQTNWKQSVKPGLDEVSKYFEIAFSRCPCVKIVSAHQITHQHFLSLFLAGIRSIKHIFADIHKYSFGVRKGLYFVIA